MKKSKTDSVNKKMGAYYYFNLEKRTFMKAARKSIPMP